MGYSERQRVMIAFEPLRGGHVLSEVFHLGILIISSDVIKWEITPRKYSYFSRYYQIAGNESRVWQSMLN